MDKRSFSEKDSIIIDKMSVKDSLFVHYLDKQLGDTMMFTIQEKCNAYIGKSSLCDRSSYSMEGKKIVDAGFYRLTKQREAMFRSFFKKTGVESRIAFQKEKNSIPYNGFSFYKIHYKGNIPKRLQRAYSQMNGLNN